MLFAPTARDKSVYVKASPSPSLAVSGVLDNALHSSNEESKHCSSALLRSSTASESPKAISIHVYSPDWQESAKRSVSLRVRCAMRYCIRSARRIACWRSNLRRSAARCSRCRHQMCRTGTLRCPSRRQGDRPPPVPTPERACSNRRLSKCSLSCKRPFHGHERKQSTPTHTI